MKKLIALSLSLLFVSASALTAQPTNFGNGYDTIYVDHKVCEEASKGGVLLAEHDEYVGKHIILKGVRVYLYRDNVYTLSMVYRNHRVTVTCRQFPKP